MAKFSEHFDFWSIMVIVVTFVLFGVALFVKGFTHDLLLEAGVLLVSIKLIISAYKTGQFAKALGEKLDKMEAKIDRLHQSQD